MKEVYQADLVTRIKQAGQEIIDRAEEMANADKITSIDINVGLDADMYYVPTISWRTEVLANNIVNNTLQQVLKDPEN